MGRHLNRGLLVALAAVAALGTVACAPPPGAGPAVDRYDSSDTFADFSHSGVPDVAANMDFWSSTDGTCTDATGGVVSNSALVLATDADAASAICRSIGLGDTLGSWNDFGYTALPANAWLCSFTISNP